MKLFHRSGRAARNRQRRRGLVRSAVERLEDRTMLDAIPLVYDTPFGNGPDDLTLRLNGDVLEVFDNLAGVAVASQPRDATSEVTITGAPDEDDALTVDFSFGGHFNVAGGVAFHGGLGGMDSLNVLGASFMTGEYLPTITRGEGEVRIRSGGDVVSVHFTGLEPVSVGYLGSFKIITPGDADDLAVTNPAFGVLAIGGTSNGVQFESVTLADVGTIMIDAARNSAGGADVIRFEPTVNGLRPLGEGVVEVEPNSDAASATVLNAGQFGSGEISLAGDIDTWIVPGGQAGDLVFAFVDSTHSFPSRDSVLDVRLNDPMGTLIERNDDEGPQNSSVVAGASLPADGDVLFQVREFYSTKEMKGYGIFQVIADASDTAAEAEGNDSSATATPVSATVMTGAVAFGSGDVDYYSFHVASDQQIVVIADEDPERDGVITDLDPLCIVNTGGLGDLECAEGSQDPPSSGEVVRTTNPFLRAGTYFVRVAHGDSPDAGPGTYRFVVLTVSQGAELSHVFAYTGTGNDLVEISLPSGQQSFGSFVLGPLPTFFVSAGGGTGDRDEIIIHGPPGQTDSLMDVSNGGVEILGRQSVGFDTAHLGGTDRITIRTGDGNDLTRVLLGGSGEMPDVAVDGQSGVDGLIVVGRTAVDDLFEATADSAASGTILETGSAAVTVTFQNVSGIVAVDGSSSGLGGDRLTVFGRDGIDDATTVGPDMIYPGQVSIDPPLVPIRFQNIDVVSVFTGDEAASDDITVSPLAIPISIDGQLPNAGAATVGDGLRLSTEIVTGLLATIPALKQTEGKGFIPSDANGAAGPTVNVALVNTEIGIYDKFTSAAIVEGELSGPIGFFGSVGAKGTVFDPKVVFDPHSRRFFVAALEGDFSTVSFVYVAISTSDAPRNLTTDWIKFRLDELDSLGGRKQGVDYTQLGVDETALYVTANMFDDNSEFSHVSLLALDKAQLLAGVETRLADLDLTDGDGTVQPALSYGGTPAGTAYFVGTVNADANLLHIYSLDLATGTIQKDVVRVTPFEPPPDVPQMDGGRGFVPIDSVDDRIMNAVFRGGSLWAAHSVDTGDGEATVRWYEFATNGRTGLGGGTEPTVVQEGLVDPGPRLHTFMPSIQVNQAGEMALGFSLSGPDIFVGAAYTGRRPSDPAGFTGPVRGLYAGEAPYQPFLDSRSGSSRNRWGDFSGLSVDPTDDSFWVFNAFARAVDLPFSFDNTGSWDTLFGNFLVTPTAATVTNTGPGAGIIQAVGFALITFAGIEQSPPEGTACGLAFDANADPAPGAQAGDGVPDFFRLEIRPELLFIVVNGSIVCNRPVANLDTITVNGSSDDDSLRVDYIDGGTLRSVRFNAGPGNDRVEESGDGDYFVAHEELCRLPGGCVFLGSVELLHIRGDRGDNVMDASGFPGMVSLDGGLGNDRLFGGTGGGFLFGDFGDDMLVGGRGNDHMQGGPGNDFLDGGLGQNMASFIDSPRGIRLNMARQPVIVRGNSRDTLTGIDDVIGSPFADLLIGNAFANVLAGGDGNDTVRGMGGDDVLDGGEGHDNLDGGIGDDRVTGGPGDDALFGRDGIDFLEGGAGCDMLFGGDGEDTMFGNEDNDLLFGERGDDFLDGGTGINTLVGGPGLDLLLGVPGIDSLFENDPNEMILNVKQRHRCREMV